MTVDITIFYSAFFEEAVEHLTEMERLLLGLDLENPVTEDLNAIFRAAHSIKGGGGIFGFSDITNLTHVLESVLDLLRKGQIKPTREMISTFLAANDIIHTQIEGHRTKTITDPTAANAMIQSLRKILPIAPDDSEIILHSPEIETKIEPPSSTIPEGANFPIQESADPGYGFFDPLPNNTSENNLSAIPDSPEVTPPDPGYGFFSDAPGAPPQLSIRTAELFPEAHDVPSSNIVDTTRSISPPKQITAPLHEKSTTRKSETGSSIRVSVEKVDQIINLVGELVITQSMLAQIAAQLDPTWTVRLQTGLDQLERNTRNLQESVMSIRMMPISVVFSRFPRMVRDLAEKLGKRVELITIGEGTELDKGLTEKLIDPLTHLVRNSIDHGIESQEIRINQGKSPLGHITLAASHQGGNIVIEVRDDGAGLNREKILAKAREQELVVNDNLPDQDVWQLIFAPGFSTAEKVTDISGRGVGMDVVRRNIQEMGGSIEINSMAGIGSTFTVRLPLTLAILDGLSVSVGLETFIIPLGYIIESMRPQPEEIHPISGRGQLVKVRDEYLPIIALYEIFTINPLVKKPEDGILVLLESEGRRIALFVDQLVGQHQVVIKSLEANFRRVDGISGATIMGDGRVALILDIGYLVRRAMRCN